MQKSTPFYGSHICSPFLPISIQKSLALSQDVDSPLERIYVHTRLVKIQMRRIALLHFILCCESLMLIVNAIVHWL